MHTQLTIFVIHPTIKTLYNPSATNLELKMPSWVRNTFPGTVLQSDGNVHILKWHTQWYGILMCIQLIYPNKNSAV